MRRQHIVGTRFVHFATCVPMRNEALDSFIFLRASCDFLAHRASMLVLRTDCVHATQTCQETKVSAGLSWLRFTISCNRSGPAKTRSHCAAPVQGSIFKQQKRLPCDPLHTLSLSSSRRHYGQSFTNSCLFRCDQQSIPRVGLAISAVGGKGSRCRPFSPPA